MEQSLRMNASNGSDADEDKINKSSLGIGAGYAISLSDNVALNPIITYHMDTWKDEYKGYNDQEISLITNKLLRQVV